MRLFVGIPIPPELLPALQAAVDPGLRGVRWSRPAGLHVTLKFLGATPPGKLDAVRTVVAQAAGATAPIRIRVAGAGAFPAADRPRVLWFGVREGSEALARLAGRLESSFASLGFVPESRPFVPHVTVARVEALGARGARSWAESHAALELDAFDAKRVLIYETQASPSGSIYEPVASFFLDT